MKKPEQKQIQAKVKLLAMETADRLEIYGNIGDSWDNESVTVSRVSDSLKESKSDKLDVHINSYGGDAFDGVAIYNLLKQSGKTVTTYVDGIAASAASIILMAGDEIIMPKNAEIMIHNPWTVVAGNSNDLRESADRLEKVGEICREAYLDHFTGTIDELQELLDEEAELTAQEAYDLGLIDTILTYEKKDDQPEKPAASAKERMLAKYRMKPAAKIEPDPEPDPAKAEPEPEPKAVATDPAKIEDKKKPIALSFLNLIGAQIKEEKHV